MVYKDKDNKLFCYVYKDRTTSCALVVYKDKDDKLFSYGLYR